jgi:hypothetical protein
MQWAPLSHAFPLHCAVVAACTVCAQASNTAISGKSDDTAFSACLVLVCMAHIQVIKTRMYCRMVGSLLHAYDYSDAACSGVHTGCNHGTALQEPKAVYDVTGVECAGDAMTFKVQVSSTYINIYTLCILR